VQPSPSYLQQLTSRLAIGLQALPESVRQRHARYLLAAQRSDGGFAGRLGDSDPYYTSFALRSLAILGELCGSVAERAADFLRARAKRPESTVDLISLVISSAVLELAAGVQTTSSIAGWGEDVARQLQQLRRPDGGYAKAAAGSAGSTYQTFLTVVCLQLLDHAIPDPEQIADFIRSQEAPLGGFREIRVVKRAGTNPTAAAIGTLSMLDALDPGTARRTATFLVEMQNDEGGMLANSRIPIADTLSTFTGLVTLHDLGATAELNAVTARRYLERLQQQQGGFHAAAWDDQTDVEYTYYGLGGLALLHATL
jgi:geranylgeranyl transferase type-2 subunit beta